jgi:rhodanese-related sulfurtransferase
MSQPDETGETTPARQPGRRSPSRRALLAGAGLAVVLAGAGLVSWRRLAPGSLPDPTDPGVSLSAVEAAVSRRFPVPEITAADLAARLPAGGVVLFDVRERDEFETSHLPGAIHLPPDTDPAAFAVHAAGLNGRVAVFYCSVGVRSGLMTQRVAALARQAGAAEVFNLRGGVFRWRAEGRALAAPGGGVTGEVHPFDDGWGALLGRSLPRSG